jgi:NADH dehydrogenase (ubiquinone) 1 alpha subcomplex subunit 9
VEKLQCVPHMYVSYFAVAHLIFDTAQVIDVAQVLANLMHSTQTTGTFSLPGPVTFTLEYLLEFVQSVAYLPPSHIPYLPKPVMIAFARLAQLPWFPMVSPDELERRYINDADVEGDWDVFGVTPGQIEDHALGALRRFRSACVLSITSTDY